MIKIILGIFCFALISCSSSQRTNFSGTSLFSYKDPSGEYLLKRDVLDKPSKIQVRQQLLTPVRSSRKPLEKSITISQIGSIKSKKGNRLSVRPYISQFSIWFEKKKYFSQFKLNKQDKTLDLIMKSPEAKWNKTISEKFPPGTVFCWFSQIPECVRRAGFLSRQKYSANEFVVVWDSYPYYTEQYQNVPSNIFSPAVIKYDGSKGGNLKFNVEVNQQLLIYHFSSSYEFEKMFWISQGITIIKSRG